jgi:hypothetical protein
VGESGFGGYASGVLCAYRCIWPPFEFLGHQVRTAQMKRVCLDQFIPQLFKFNGSLYPSFSTKNPNSFPKHDNSLVLSLSAPNQRRNGGQESLAAWPLVLHECGEKIDIGLGAGLLEKAQTQLVSL